jgi:hypothetical protein
MDQSPSRTPIIQPLPRGARDALVQLTLLGWGGGLAAIVAGLAVSFLLFGYALVYWRNADMDLMVIYNALVLNDGKPQQFFDHTAYLTILSVKYWFQLLHGLGLLDSYSLSTFPRASDPKAFDAAMTAAVRAGRVLAWLTASGCVLAFAALVRLIVRDWRVALIAAFAFAFSGGIAVHSRILRSELMAAFPVILALMLLIVIARRASIARPLWMGLAAALCVFGLENKVQAILLIGALPILALPFGGKQGASASFWRNPRSGIAATIALTVTAVAAAWASWPLVAAGYDRMLLDAAHLHPLLLGRFGAYQLALLALIVTCMVAFAVLWHVSGAETLASIAAMIVGACVALLALDLDYNANNVIAVFNPLEKMLSFADADTAAAANGSNLSAVARLILDGVASVLARYSFVLHSSPRPAVFLAWLIVPGIVYAWHRGQRQVSLQALLLFLAAAAIDAIGVRRGLKSEYFIFTDPLIILAGAILLDNLTELRTCKWAPSIAVALFVLQIVVGQSEPVKYAFMRRGPEPICEWNRHYLPLMPLYWCAATNPRN